MAPSPLLQSPTSSRSRGVCRLYRPAASRSAAQKLPTWNRPSATGTWRQSTLQRTRCRRFHSKTSPPKRLERKRDFTAAAASPFVRWGRSADATPSPIAPFYRRYASTRTRNSGSSRLTMRMYADASSSSHPNLASATLRMVESRRKGSAPSAYVGCTRPTLRRAAYPRAHSVPVCDQQPPGRRSAVTGAAQLTRVEQPPCEFLAGGAIRGAVFPFRHLLRLGWPRPRDQRVRVDGAPHACHHGPRLQQRLLQLVAQLPWRSACETSGVQFAPRRSPVRDVYQVSLCLECLECLSSASSYRCSGIPG